MDDTELLRRFAEERDEMAFACFVQRHAGVVLGSALRRLQGDEHRAREVAQQVFVSAARRARELARHRCVTAWLFTATRNAAYNLMRDEQRRARWERAAAEAAELDGSEAGALDQEAWREIGPVLDQAIDGLGERDREAVLLRYFSGLPLAEIGRRLGLSENAARMRVQRALEMLHDALVKKGVTSSAGLLGSALAARASVAVSAEVAGGWAQAACANVASVATVGAGLGWGGFMGVGKTVGGIAGAVAVLGGIAWWSIEWRAGRARMEAELEWVGVRNIQAAQQAEIRRIDAAEKRLAALRQTAAGTGRAESAANERANSLSPASDWDPEQEGNALMAKHPALKTVVLARADAEARFRFARTLMEMGATAQQIDALVELMREGNIISSPLGPKGAMLVFHAGEGLAPDEVGRRMKETLGPAIFGRMEEVFRRAEVRSLTHDVAAALTFSEARLTSEQARTLEALLMRSSRPKSGVDWDQVKAEAPAFLSGEQLASVERARSAEEERKLRNGKPVELVLQRKEGGR